MEGVSFAACGEANDLKLVPTKRAAMRGWFFALAVQPAAAMIPRTGGGQGGRSPPALLSPHFFGKKCHTVRRYVHPHREGGKPLRPKAHGNRRRPARRPEPP